MGISSNPAGLQNQLPISVEWPVESNEISDKLYDVYQDIANAVNSKLGGLYVPQEKITSGQYFNTANVQVLKNVYRMVIDFGALPNTGTKSVAHNINVTSATRFTLMYGDATDPINLKGTPIPNSDINLKTDATMVIITTESDYSAYTESTVVLEYTKG